MPILYFEPISLVKFEWKRAHTNIATKETSAVLHVNCNIWVIWKFCNLFFGKSLAPWQPIMPQVTLFPKSNLSLHTWAFFPLSPPPSHLTFQFVFLLLVRGCIIKIANQRNYFCLLFLFNGGNKFVLLNGAEWRLIVCWCEWWWCWGGGKGTFFLNTLNGWVLSCMQCFL